MTNSKFIPPIPYLKHKAKEFRLKQAEQNISISHSDALEALAKIYGYRDWNILSAIAKKQSSIVNVGQRVKGRYLGKVFEGMIKAVRMTSDPDKMRITIVFDHAIDVVPFDSFSNFRKQVSCYLTQKAMTNEITSNGQPQLILDL